MSNFLFAINATLPIFILIVLGSILKHKEFLNDNFVNIADKLVFKLALPALVFIDIATIDMKSGFNYKFALFCFLSTLVFIILTWVFAEIFIKDKKSIGSFVQGGFRSSAAVLGVAFAQNIYGDSGLVPVMIIASVPLFNIFSVIVLTRSDVSGEKSMKEAVKKAAKGVATNPIIWGILLGIPFAYFGITLPTIAMKSLTMLGNLSTPLALLSIGASFSLKHALTKIPKTVAASLIKLVILPAIFIPIAIYLGFREEELVAIMIMLGSPSTPSGYIMAKSMNNDYELSSGIIVITTLFSSVTITLIIYILRALQYI